LANTTISQEMTMEMVITRRSTENMEYVRRLLARKQPAFSLTLELAVMLAEQELWPPEGPRDIGAAADA
jgi:hypothetical protein